MATKKTYGSSRAFTEGHLEVLGDQSVEGKFDAPPEDPKVLARYAQQREFNAKPASERRTNDRHWQDSSFPARLKAWEAQNPVGVWKQHRQPKPVDYGRDRGGNYYTEARTPIGEPNFGGVTGKGNVGVDQAIWKDGRDGRPLTKQQKLSDQRDRDGVPLTRRQKADQYSAQQPYARNELKTGIQGNFGTLGNFFNEDD